MAKYSFRDIFNIKSFQNGFKRLETELIKIDKLIKDLGRGQGGQGLRNLNTLVSKLAKSEQTLKKVQKERQTVQRQQSKWLKNINKENQKRLRNLRKVGDSLNKEKVFEKELLKLKQQRIRQEQKLRAQRALGIKQTKSWASSMKGLLLQIRNIGVALFAFQRLKSITDKYVQAAQDQLIVEQKLEVILEQRTGATKAQTKSVIELTRAEQKRGILGDEIQIAGAQQIATFVTTTKNVKTLIPAINNLVAQQKGFNATQQDAVNVANAIGKVFTGQIGALTRYGITIDDTSKKILKFGTEEEKAAELAKVITNNVGNMNEELAKTDIGQLQQMNNVLGDIEEQIGMKLLPITVKFKKAWLELLTDIDTFTSGINRNLNETAKNQVKLFTESIKLADQETKQASVKKFLLNIEKDLLKLRKEFLLLGDKKLDLDNEDSKRIRDNIAVLERQKELIVALGKEKFFLGQFTEKTTEEIEKFTEKTGKAKKSVKQLADEIERVIELSGSLRGEAGLPGITEIGRIDEIEGSIREESRQFIEILRDGLRSEAEKVEGDGILNKIFGKIFGTGDDESSSQRRELIKNAVNQLFETIKQSTEDALERLDQLIDRQNDAIQNTTDLLNAENQRIQQLQLAGAAFDTSNRERLQRQLAQEKAAKEKLLAEETAFRKKQNRLKQIEAGSQIALNVLKALGQPPIPGTNWIAAGIAATLGAIQLATIRGAKFEKGTNYLHLNGNPRGTDTIPFLGRDGSINMLNEGERIVPTKFNSAIPRTFPNSELPNAVQYYINGGGTDNSVLSKIEKNTRDSGKVYNPSTGKLKSVNTEDVKITWC
jgi:hypothetical protein